MAGTGTGRGRKVYNRGRVLRAEMELARRELADKLGMEYRTLGYIEREQYNPSQSLAWRICAFFELPTDAVWSAERFCPILRKFYGHRGVTGR